METFPGAKLYLRSSMGLHVVIGILLHNILLLLYLLYRIYSTEVHSEYCILRKVNKWIFRYVMSRYMVSCLYKTLDRVSS